MGLIFQPPSRAEGIGRELVKVSSTKPQAAYALSGRLYRSDSNWILLSVPNALIRGAFDALDEQGVELPPGKPTFNGHISVIRPEELDEIGGADKITERGHTFKYQLGKVKTVTPHGWKEMSKVWMIEVKSPELEKFRKSYGLSARPKDNEFAFHITIAVRRKKVLQTGEVSKAAFTLPWLKLAKKKKRKQPPGYIKETEEIKARQCGAGAKPHKFQAAKWTHPNGHPRCKICGDEETLDGQCEGHKTASVLLKMALSSRGIPDRSQQGDLGRVRAGQLLDLIVQRHQAQRAGEHLDVRIGNPELGLYSWATRKGLPEPGGRHQMFRQPLHSHAYGDFQGAIAKGYGAGTVRRERKGQVLVTKVEDDKIAFTTADERYPERFILFRPRASMGKRMRHWLMVNVTPQEPIPYQKVHYKKIPAEQVEPYLEQLQEGDSVQAKVDGASSLVTLLKDGVEVVSYRASKTTGRPIIHTERMFHGRPQLDIPPQLAGTVLKGELYGEKGPLPRRTQAGQRLPPDSEDTTGNGSQDRRDAGQAGGIATVPPGQSAGGGAVENIRRAIPPQELGGLLNAALGKSIQAQRDQGIRLQGMLHNVQRLGNVDVTDEVPYAKRREILAKVLPFLPEGYFHLPEEAKAPGEAQTLWRSVLSGSHPLTQEGIVIHPSTGKPVKAKQLEDTDVHITGTFPGKGRLAGTGAGGFSYAMEPGGKSVGEVGSGLSDELRRELHADPKAFLGRVARIRSQGAFPSGALRAPSLIAMHEDYPKAAFAKTAIWSWLKRRFEPLATATPLPGVGARLRGTPLTVDVDPTGPGFGLSASTDTAARVLDAVGADETADRLAEVPGRVYGGLEWHLPFPIPLPMAGLAAGAADKNKLMRLVRKWQERRKEKKDAEKKAASPYWQRAGLAQLHNPAWQSGKGLLGNIMANLWQARQRGQQLVGAQDIAKDMASSQSSQGALARMQNYLSQGDFVKDPVDKALFRPLPRF